MSHERLQAPHQQLEIADAARPRSEEYALDVLQRAEPLYGDTPHSKELYGDMGVVRTGLERGKELFGHEVYYKDERQQLSGSYKSGGASWAAMQTNPMATLVTYSTGNHGTSLGIAGARRGQQVVVEGTASMSSAKGELVRGTGADVNAVHTSFKLAEDAARERAEQPGHVLVEPFGNPDVVAGQCRLGIELVQDLLERGLAHQTVVIPVSVAGGGQIAGFALPVWKAKQEGILGPDIRIVAVQPEGTDTLRRAVEKVRSGQAPCDLYNGGRPDPRCDALVIGEENLNADTLAVVADTQLVQGFYTVSPADIGRAMTELEAEAGGVVEPAAALPYAFAKAYGQQFPGYMDDANEPVTFVLPISGGNKSPETAEAYRLAVAQDDNRLRSEAHLSRKPEWFEPGGEVREYVGAVALGSGRSGTRAIGGANFPRMKRSVRG
jgi:threonine dehydratase